MDFEFSDEQELLREQARGFLADNCPPTVVRKVLDGDAEYDAELWQKVAEMGWTATVIPEEFGGLGLSYLELVVIAEELGINHLEVSTFLCQVNAERKAAAIKLNVPAISEPAAKIKNGMVEVCANTPANQRPAGGSVMFLDTPEGKETLERVKQSYKAFVPSKWRNRQVVSIEDLRA